MYKWNRYVLYCLAVVIITGDLSVILESELVMIEP